MDFINTNVPMRSYADDSESAWQSISRESFGISLESEPTSQEKDKTERAHGLPELSSSDRPRRPPDETSKVGLNGVKDTWKNADGTSENRITTDDSINFWRVGKDGKTIESMSIQKDPNGEQMLYFANLDGQVTIIGSKGYRDHTESNVMYSTDAKGKTSSIKLPSTFADTTIQAYRKEMTR